MIISASYKTDIPAFYGAWFLNRLRAGYCRMINPYNRRAVYVPLTRDAVDGFVFWTKNLAPFIPALEVVAADGYPFAVQYTINAYPRTLEFSVTDPARSVRHVHWLRAEFGQHAAVWRYDPVLFTSEMDAAFHERNFASLAAALEGATDEVVISFAQIYRKTERNLKRSGVAWSDPEGARKRELAEALSVRARQHGMQLSICSQPEYAVPASANASCISSARLTAIAGTPIAAPQKGNRPGCACDASRDIGDYDTCPHGCVYCYAVRDHELARQRFRAHDPNGEFLFTPV